MKGRAASRGKPALVSVGAFSAKVYSTPIRGVPRFTMVWQDPAAGRRRETFATFEAAKARAEAVARSLLRGDATAAGFTGTERARFAAILDLLGSTGVPAEIASAQFAEGRIESWVGGASWMPPGSSPAVIVWTFPPFP